jgi:hypothetical protein
MRSDPTVRLELSADQIAEIVESLRDHTPTGPSDVRRASRMKLRGHVQITPCTAGGVAPIATAVGVQVEDVSARGIGIIHNSALPCGSQFILHLGGQKRKIVEVLCTVHHCDRTRAERYRIGAEFTCSVGGGQNEPNEAELKRISQSILD